MKRYGRMLLVALTLCTVLGTASAARACPMCKSAMEDQEDPSLAARPRAYMYSILFMLSMPAALFSAFAISFYRMSRKQQALQSELLANLDIQPGARPDAE